MEALSAEAPQHDLAKEEREVSEGDSVHLSFGYGSDLTQFSDRVIRVHVVQDDDQEEPSFGTRLKETYLSQSHAASSVSATGSNEQSVDLEMQSTGCTTTEKERGWSYDIPISSLIVAAHSEYFKTMLLSGLQESRTKEKPIEVTLCPQGAHFFNILIEFAYTHHIPPDVRSDKESLCCLLTVADRFEATQCMQKGAKELKSSPTSLEDAVMYLNLPETVKRHPALRDLMDSVSGLTGWSFEDVAACDNFCAITEASMMTLVSHLRVSDDHVEAVFALMLEWFRFRGPERWSGFETLLSHLGFWRMSPSFVREEVEACPELRGREGRALVEQVKALKDPWEEVKAAAASQELAALQGAAIVVAGAAPAAGGPAAPAKVGPDPGMVFFMMLGGLAGFIVPLIFATPHQSGSVDLICLTFSGILPGSGTVMGMIIGSLFGLKLNRRR
ncbi:hypothetical protein KFL_000190290 [Klebsormidium nitens]|uniref:BTB domain-containing protein n=1 Tax=Klebsormidium nitens TaxID=105231 RepID=A0A1Y1HJU8_KLENI|nr:hypothetical protein KFL_000190290 [Klebsormidium nitens]|eukprot:GAQ78810.1 hypothetical protein KFL_000190290 [Klebsormidium nitens]